MSLLGYMAAGLAQGVGAGLTAVGVDQADAAKRSALEKREIALAQLKAQNDKSAADTKFERDGLLLDHAARNDIIKTKATNLDKVTTLIPAETAAAKDIDAAKAAQSARLARLNSTLDRQEDAESQKIKADIDNGKIRDVEQGPDGAWQIHYNNGTIRQMKTKGLIKSASADEGGALGAARAAAGNPAPEAAPAPRPKLTPNKPMKVVSQSDYAETLAAAGMNPAFKGWPAAKIKAYVDDQMKAKGMKLGG